MSIGGACFHAPSRAARSATVSCSPAAPASASDSARRRSMLIMLSFCECALSVSGGNRVQKRSRTHGAEVRGRPRNPDLAKSLQHFVQLGILRVCDNACERCHSCQTTWSSQQMKSPLSDLDALASIVGRPWMSRFALLEG